ncbi:hypothetical protein D9615_001139 [Tricholomella constricta]|uniref:DRBM domain-containing protein n=1 Tax=Tricholomella constricta TaxID=117010 RepID=A0A8H5HL93_9AGAR|nr:hypothetical protein D9615_001139 [Tricholomella constricta]
MSNNFQGGASPRDYINEFNTVGQRRGLEVQYECTSTGPKNNELWTATLSLGGTTWTKGSAKTKREAKANAARDAIALVQNGY